MTKAPDADALGKVDSHQRLRALLKGAFAGPPTPLKAIPKRNGESRTAAKKAKIRKRPS